MYLEHFHLNKPPFSLTPKVEFFCNLPGYQEALNVLLFSLNSGEGFIKIVGEVGSGKTLLCRKLLMTLDENYVTAYIPNPDLDADGLRRSVARELHIHLPLNLHRDEVTDQINKKLLEIKAMGKQVVLLIDEAQALPNEALEAVRLLTNLETETEKLLQIVLFGQPELDDRLLTHEFRQLNQRITFSHYLQPLNREELDSYLNHRLMTAGNTTGALFDRKATDDLFKLSRGIPRVVNILAHKSMLAAYGWGDTTVTKEAVQKAVEDSRNLKKTKAVKTMGWKQIGVIFVLLFFFGIVYYKYLNYLLGL